eukprot:c21516_g1_i1 orf=232-702(+)
MLGEREKERYPGSPFSQSLPYKMFHGDQRLFSRRLRFLFPCVYLPPPPYMMLVPLSPQVVKTCANPCQVPSAKRDSMRTCTASTRNQPASERQTVQIQCTSKGVNGGRVRAFIPFQQVGNSVANQNTYSSVNTYFSVANSASFPPSPDSILSLSLS